MSDRHRTFLLPAFCSAAIFGVGLLLPLWHWSKFTSRDALAKGTVPLWHGLIDPPPPSGYKSLDDEDRYKNLASCVTLAVVAGVVGLAVFYGLRPRTRFAEAGDYSEGPGGVVRDGRA